MDEDEVLVNAYIKLPLTQLHILLTSFNHCPNGQDTVFQGVFILIHPGEHDSSFKGCNDGGGQGIGRDATVEKSCVFCPSQLLFNPLCPVAENFLNNLAES